MKLPADPEVYSEAVLERFENPPQAGWLEAPSRSGCAASAVRNSEICFALQMADGAVETARFKARGCPHTIAAASLAAERLEGLKTADLREFTAEFLVDELAIPANKLDIRILVEDAVRAAARAEQ